ncbi:methionine aminotransferase [Pollutibacter soli]|uniref:methionine aminotransferase n=1 Tax=Pollutibacter soli TaxID=3034157 RepID=UPI00301405EC
MNYQMLPLSFSSKLPDAGTTIFTVMSALAIEHNAVNLGQGFPDFPMNQELACLAAKAITDGYNQYAPMAGWMPLRESIAEKVDFLYSLSVDPDSEITIVPGGTCAIYCALTAILQPGDEVIVFEPAYDSYIPNILVNKAVPIKIPLSIPDFRIDWNSVKSAITEKTRAIVINTPHNPTGSILSASDLQQLSALVKGTGIYVVSDEVYEHLVFDGKQHESVLRYPELFARSFVCYSFGKVYNCTGWKLGYCISPAELTTEFRKIYQFNAFSAFTPTQVAIASFLKNHAVYLELSQQMQENRDYFINLMRATDFNLLHSSGSYFICGTYERISDEPDKDLALRLTKEAGVVTIPVSAFYQDSTEKRILRFCFSKKKETLELAVDRLIKYLGH